MKKIFLIAILLILSLNVLLAQKKEKAKSKSVEVTYENCTVYTGKTDYFFKRVDNKEEILVIVSNESLGVKTIKVPKGLIDDDKNLEGLPGAHPKMIGKKFLIIYENDEIVKVVHFQKNKKEKKK